MKKITSSSESKVEICDDLACVILNEMGQATSDAILDIVNKKPKKGSLNVVEEYFRFNPNDKWWVVTFDWNEELNTCNRW